MLTEFVAKLARAVTFRAAHGGFAAPPAVRPMSTPLSFPAYITIDATNVCNAHCVFCKQIRPPMLTPRHLDFLLGKMEHVIPKARELAFVGWGELLLMPGIVEYLESLNRRFPDTLKKIVTHGGCFTKEIIAALAEGRYKIEISLHAASEELHTELIRHQRFSKIIRDIAELASRRHRHRVEIHLMFVMNRANMRELPRFVEMAADLGADCVRVEYMQITKPDVTRLSCWYEQAPANAFIEEARGMAEKRRMAVDFPPLFDLHAAPAPVNGASAFEFRCREPWQSFRITMNGHVLPCCYGGDVELRLGNVADQEFDEIWRGARADRLRSRMSAGDLLDVCRGCRLNNTVSVNSLSSHIHPNLMLEMKRRVTRYPAESGGLRAEETIFRGESGDGVSAQVLAYERLIEKGFEEYERNVRSEGQWADEAPVDAARMLAGSPVRVGDARVRDGVMRI